MADPNHATRVAAHGNVSLVPFPDPETATPRLPVPLTSFVGRSREIDALVGLVRRPVQRLVTLTGPGGVGKTRLAIRTAEDLAGDFPGGVWFVPLAPVRDAALVPVTIAHVLGVNESDSRTIESGIRDFLHDRHALLVLDNLEHLPDAGNAIVELLTTCPSLSILATSRVALQVSGEQIVLVPPFPIAGRDGDRRGADHPQSDAAILFLERARAARSDFAPTNQDAPAIEAICEKLDGLPLAIELAAARISVLSPVELQSVVESRLAVLTGGPRDQPARLRSMRDAIGWSYDLLSDENQRFFRRLAVFVGGFTIEGAAAVANDGADCLDRLTTLVASSLVIRDEQRDVVADAPRYTMLETIREFGLEQLAVSGEEFQVRQMHADYFYTLIERITPSPRWPPTEARIRVIYAERNNLRATFEWLDRIDEFERYLHLGAALYPLWGVLGHVSEGLQVLEHGVTEGTTVPPFPRAVAHAHAGSLTNMLGDPMAGLVMIEESLAWARTVAEPTRDNRLDMAIMQSQIGQSLISMGRFDESVPPLEQYLTESRLNGSEANVSRAIYCLSLAAYGSGDLERARTLIEECLIMCRQIGNTFYTAESLALGGLIATEIGEIAVGAITLAEALELGVDAVDHNGDAERIGIVGVLANRSGAPGVAACLFSAAQSLAIATGTTHKMPIVTTFEREAATARLEIGDDGFAGARAMGQRFSRHEALAKAQGYLRDLSDSLNDKGELAPVEAHGLTPREREVVRLVAAGYSNRKIATNLSISERTVEHHVLHVLAKLGLESRTAVAVFAHANGLA